MYTHASRGPSAEWHCSGAAALHITSLGRQGPDPRRAGRRRLRWPKGKHVIRIVWPQTGTLSRTHRHPHTHAEGMAKGRSIRWMARTCRQREMRTQLDRQTQLVRPGRAEGYRGSAPQENGLRVRVPQEANLYSLFIGSFSVVSNQLLGDQKSSIE